jgi:hypothetical protein
VDGERRSMKRASRTLVKSQPELWELIDQPSRMQGLMCALLGRATEVKVNEREPESILCWEAAESDQAWIKVKLAEKGWGTRVEVSAENPTETVRLEGWLDAVLDELATPEKRPFGGMDQQPPASKTPPEVVPADAPPAEPAPPETTTVEEAPVEEAPVEETPVEEAAVETSSPTPPKKKRRRFFGF